MRKANAGRLAAHRSAVHGRRVFPTPAFGGIVQRCRLRRFQLGGQQLLASRPRGTPAWPHREIRAAAPRRASRSLLTSKAGSRRTNSTGKPGIVAQWASLHSGVAGPWLHDWVKADKLNAAYVAAWEAANPDDVAKWKSDNNSPDPKPEDLAAGIAGGFFTSFSKDHPGTFPGVAEYEKDGKTAKTIGPVKEGSDIQSLFFDMWLQEHPDVDLERVPADMVMSSGSGLDPRHHAEQRPLATGQSRRRRLGKEDRKHQRERVARPNRAVAARQEPCAAGRPGRRAAGERVGGQSCPAGPLSEGGRGGK